MNESAYVPDPKEYATYTVLEGGDLGSGGSGGGGGDKQVYAARNPSPPDNPALEAISYDADGIITQWNTVTQAWE